VIVAEQESDERGNHAETLLAMVDAVLVAGGVPLSGVEGFAVTIGPGSFTSLRVGLATVKGLAFGGDAPVAAVSTLAALAWEAGGRDGTPIAAALDARRGEVYGAVFRCRNDAQSVVVETLSDEGLFSPEAFAELLPARCLAVGSGAELHAQAMGVAEGGPKELCLGVSPSARATGALGAAMLARGQGLAAAELVPRYLRRAEAEALRLGSEVEATG